MLASILCAVLMSPGSFQDQNPKSIWDGLNIQRTGNNGYEEYLDAIDLFRQARISSILMERGSKASPNELEVCRRILAKMSPTLAKVEQGNLKEVRDPRTKFSYDTLFPEFSYLKEIIKAIHACAHAQFAAGDTKGATNNLILGLEMSDKSGRFTLISGLMGVAVHAILLDSISKNLSQLSVSECIRFEQWVNSHFSKPNQVAQVMAYESFWAKSMLTNEVMNMKKEDLQSLVGMSEEETDDSKEWNQFFDEFTRLPSSEKRRIIAVMSRRVETRLENFQKLTVLPEKKWQLPKEGELQGFEGKLCELIEPTYSNILDVFARHRTQLRLLRLHCAIRQFRFENNQLPESLSKLNKPLYILDPLTDENFVYEQKGELAYDLYSKGNAQTGRIDLRYRRAPSEEKTDPSIPPFMGSRLVHQR